MIMARILIYKYAADSQIRFVRDNQSANLRLILLNLESAAFILNLRICGLFFSK